MPGLRVVGPVGAVLLLRSVLATAVDALRRPSDAEAPGHGAVPSVAADRLALVGACITRVRTLQSTAAERGVVLVELGLRLSSDDTVRTVTWQVEVAAVPHLQPGSVITVGWDAVGESVWPIEDWARRWPR